MSTRKHKVFGREVSLELPTEADQSVFHEVFIDRDYKILDATIQNAQHPILDIGAHIGLFAVYASLLNPKVPITAFEPVPANFAVLKQHLKSNRIKNVATKNLAVSDQIGDGTIFLSPDSHNHSLLQETDTPLSVRSTSLEKILTKFDQVSLAKIDCEGAEFPIILNTPDEALTKIRNFYIEYHEFTPSMSHKNLTSRLSKLGFKVQAHPSHYQKNLGFILATK